MFWHEPTLHQEIWEEIKREMGLSIHGETTLSWWRSDGERARTKPDLIGYFPENDEYYAFEVKVNPHPETRDMEGTSLKKMRVKARQREKKNEEQFKRIIESGYFDYCYLCCVKAPELLRYIREDLPDETLRKMFQPIEMGMIKVDENGRIEKIIKAERINRERKPKLPKDNEGWVRHYVWRKFGRICDGALPNPERERPLKIDIVSFRGSEDPSEIYLNQDKMDLIGIEAKGRNFNLRKTKEQLDMYLVSGGLTKLFLAIPEGVKREGIVKEIPEEVGIITVNEEGDVETDREAEKVEMRYDSIKFFMGYVEPKGGRFLNPIQYGREVTVSVGWGKSVDKYYSLFDQTMNS